MYCMGMIGCSSYCSIKGNTSAASLLSRQHNCIPAGYHDTVWNTSPYYSTTDVPLYGLRFSYISPNGLLHVAPRVFTPWGHGGLPRWGTHIFSGLGGLEGCIMRSSFFRLARLVTAVSDVAHDLPNNVNADWCPVLRCVCQWSYGSSV
jgi:hypothetical protein